MPKKKTTEQESKGLSEREEGFLQDVVAGLDTIIAYRKWWKNGYSDAKCRYEGKSILEREHVQKRLQELILERQLDVLLDEKFVIDLLKRTAIEQFGKNVGVKALELLGKKLAMWTDKQIIDETKDYREQAERIWNEHLRKKEANEIEFPEKDGTDD